MDESSFKRCKFLMFFFNFLFMLGGLAVVGIGIWITIDSNGLLGNILSGWGNVFTYIGYAVIGVGSLVTLIAFLGCCGAITENKVALSLFSCMVGLFLVFSVVLAGLSFAVVVYYDLLTKTLFDGVFITYTGTGASPTDDFIDQMQQDHKCCGSDNGDDYKTSVYGKNPLNNSTWPDSCCVASAKAACQAVTTATDANPENSYAGTGCFEKVKDVVTSFLYIIGGVTCGLALLQILALIFSCCVNNNIGKVEPWN